jgi:hypothetical protein
MSYLFHDPSKMDTDSDNDDELPWSSPILRRSVSFMPTPTPSCSPKRKISRAIDIPKRNKKKVRKLFKNKITEKNKLHNDK